MSIGVVGRKCGMTRILQEDGASVPVTVVEVLPNIVTQKKSQETDGYDALQITTGQVKASRVNKAKMGHFAKNNIQTKYKTAKTSVNVYKNFCDFVFIVLIQISYKCIIQ